MKVGKNNLIKRDIYQQCFLIQRIPCCIDSRLKNDPSEDLSSISVRGIECILRSLTDFESQSLRFSNLYCFDPHSCTSNLRDRLSIQIQIASNNSKLVDTVSTLLLHGPINRLYKLHQHSIQETEIPQEASEKGYCYSIQKNEIEILAICSDEENPFTPPYFYNAYPYTPNNDNTFSDFDRILHGINEKIKIEVTAQPFDHSNILKESVKYLNQLKQCSNRFRQQDAFPDHLWDGESKEKNGFSKPLQNVFLPNHKPDLMAEDFIRLYKNTHQVLLKPQLLISINVWAETEYTARFIASYYAQQCTKDGTYHIKMEPNENNENSFINYEIKNSYSKIDDINSNEKPDSYTFIKQISNLATVEEILPFFQLPISKNSSLYTLRTTIDPPTVPNDQKSILIGWETRLSEDHIRDNVSSSTKDFFKKSHKIPYKIELPLKLLPKHGISPGASGTGKTTAIQNISLSAYLENIPFLILELRKKEHRVLTTLQSHPDERIREFGKEIRVYSIGDEQLLPLRFSPFEHPLSVSCDEHSENLLTCLQAAIPTFAALPSIFQQAIRRAYRENQNQIPTLSELKDHSLHVLKKMNYSGETHTDMRAAIENRLGRLITGTLGKIFDTRSCIPDIETLLKYPTIIELDKLEEWEASFFVILLLNAIRKYIVHIRRPGTDIQHFIILEEAHGCIGKSADATVSELAPDTISYSTKLTKRIISEYRNYGEGALIADQSPSAIAPEILNYTRTKMASGLLSEDDRMQMAGAMQLSPQQCEDLSRLMPGEAYFMTEGFYTPCKIQTPNIKEILGIGESPNSKELKETIEKTDWYSSHSLQVMHNDLLMLGEKMDLFDRLIITCAQKMLFLCKEKKKVEQNKDAWKQRDLMHQIHEEISSILETLEEGFHELGTDHNSIINNPRFSEDKQDRKTQILYQKLSNRYRQQFIPVMNKWRNKLENLLKEYNALS